jgi:hypothetical protein
MEVAMTSGEWHVGEEIWHAYAEGRLDPVAESSVEAHVAGCERCHATARGQVAVEQLEPVWTEISVQVQRPQQAWPLRWLRRAGAPEADTVVIGASDGLSLSWTVAVGAALVCAMIAGLAPRYQDVWFLLLAPLVPVLAVMASFDATDSLRELVAPTPYSKLRTAILRTAAAVAVAVPVTLGVGLLLPGLAHLAFVWLLPGLVMTCSALVLITWLTAWQAGAVLAVTWTVAVLALARLDTLSLLWSPTAQAAFAATAALMIVVLVHRTTTLHPRRGAS